MVKVPGELNAERHKLNHWNSDCEKLSKANSIPSCWCCSTVIRTDNCESSRIAVMKIFDVIWMVSQATLDLQDVSQALSS